MKTRNLIIVIATVLTPLFFTSCSTTGRTMKEAYTRVEFQKDDFTLSDQKTGEATAKYIFGIDFDRLFHTTSGATVKNGVAPTIFDVIATIPVIGTKLVDPTSSYAIYDLMKNNEGYDVVFYPQYVRKVEKPIGLGFLYRIVTVKATARLGKLKK